MSALMARAQAVEIARLRERFLAQVQAHAVMVIEGAETYDSALAGLMVDFALPWLRRSPKSDPLAVEDRIGDRLADAVMEREFEQAGLPRIWARRRRRRIAQWAREGRA